MSSFRLLDAKGAWPVGEEDAVSERVRYFATQDLAMRWHVPRAFTLAERFDPNNVSADIEDILELHNVQQYLEHGPFPGAYSKEELDRAMERIPQIRSAVAKFFSLIDNTNFDTKVAGVGYEYHRDLLDLLGRGRVFERCDGATVIPSLMATGVSIVEMLGSKKLVHSYSAEVRDLLRFSTRGAEHLIQTYLQDDSRRETHLPSSFTPADIRELLESYIDSKDANLNYVGLIATARENHLVGIDAKLKLRAKRRGNEISAELFDEGQGFKLGCEVSISETQDEAVSAELDSSEGHVTKYTYSRRWLEETCDNPSVLNNFIHLFGFVNRHGLLVLPSYPAQLSVMERVLGATGKEEYKVGAAFRDTEMRTRLQTHVYRQYLESKSIDLEQIFSWFFEQYLLDEFEASNFSFSPSGDGASYLQRVRHLFAEMESVVYQFDLFAKDGEIDRDLLAMRSDQVRYAAIPSLLDGKYMYPCESKEIASIIYLLFSDQSPLTYIDDNLKAGSGAELLLRNEVSYTDFHDYQKPGVDRLITLGILEDAGRRVNFANVEQFLILRSLFNTQAVSYYHLSNAGRLEADSMVAKGWTVRQSSLLTESEGKYFSYLLNAADFSNGPNLRNAYLHGVQDNTNGEAAHLNTYITALRLIVALVIKMNDDFCLSAAERLRSRTDTVAASD